MFNPFGDPDPAPAKPVRHTFPARGQAIRLEFRRQGQSLRFQVFDEMAKEPREIGKVDLGPADIAGVKLFVANRNGAEPVDVLFRDLVVHADRISGLGTTVRTIHGTDVHGRAHGTRGRGPGCRRCFPPPGPHGRSPAGNPPTAALVDLPDQVFASPTAPDRLASGGVVADLPDQVFASPTTAPVRLASGGVVADLPDQVFVSAPGPQANPGPKIKARIPLDELETIVFERASMLAVKYVGQPNVDTTGPGGAPGKDAKDEKKGAGDDLSAPPPGTVPIVPDAESRA